MVDFDSEGIFMAYYHLEPVLYFTHVLKAYTDVDRYVEVKLLKDNKPLDFSEATGITMTADKENVPSGSVDMSRASEGVLRISFRGFAPGAYWVPVSLTLNGETIVFGHFRVFVQDTRRSDDVTDFYYYPDTDEEEEEWESEYGEGEEPDEETEPGPEEDEQDEETESDEDKD